ncbi:major capsid family protein [Thiolapillus sp.]|uniref:major capsid family protein n=1 Tax=Thiolapillus sp. TaxID=2017437 RepID=UPI003AF75CF2
MGMISIDNKVEHKYLEDFADMPIPAWTHGVNWDMYGGKFNRDNGVLFATQLRYMEAQLYETKYPALKSREIFPIDYAVPAGAKEAGYDMWDGYGEAKVIDNYSDDLPMVGVSMSRSIGPIAGFGVGADYSIQDIREAQMAGMPLNAFKLRVARRAWEIRLDNIALNGIPDVKIPGFLSISDVPTSTASGTTTSWANKDGEAMLKDMYKMVTDTRNLTNGVEEPNRLVMSDRNYSRIMQTRVSQYTDKKVLPEFLENCRVPGMQVIPWFKLQGASAGSDKMISFRYDQDVVKLIIPLEFEMLPPQPRNLTFVINTHARCGGIQMVYPKACRKMENL